MSLLPITISLTKRLQVGRALSTFTSHACPQKLRTNYERAFYVHSPLLSLTLTAQPRVFTTSSDNIPLSVSAAIAATKLLLRIPRNQFNTTSATPLCASTFHRLIDQELITYALDVVNESIMGNKALLDSNNRQTSDQFSGIDSSLQRMEHEQRQTSNQPPSIESKIDASSERMERMDYAQRHNS